jgi:hypothetical protein
MKHDAEQSIAMSYVDTIMNSMGCLLVLFLLLTAIRGPLMFGTEESAEAEDRDESVTGGVARFDRPERSRDAFVLLATPADGATLFPEPVNRGWPVWEFVAGKPPTDRDLGPSFALMLLDAEPPGEVRLTRLRPGLSAVRIRVVQGGKELLTRRVEVVGGSAKVWPPAAEEKTP